jgi:hypothetical protein
MLSLSRGITFISALLAFSAFEASAITVCSSGADYTDGEVALRALEPGGELLFCAGETFPVRATYRLGNMQGARVGAYGSGEVPTLNGDIIFEGAPTSHITFDGLRFRGDGTGHGIRVDSGSSDITITNSVIENYNTAVYVRKRTGSDTVSNFTLSHSVIQNNVHQGFLGGGPGLYVGYNTFINNGQRGVFDHNIYFGCKNPGNGDPCPTLIEHNEMQGASQDSEGKCQGAEIVGHGYVNGTTIRNNVLQEPEGALATCYGIMINPSYSELELMSNISITGNQIYNVGRAGIMVEAADGIYVADNTIYMTNPELDISHTGVQIRNGSEPLLGGNYVADVVIENNDIKLRKGTGVNIWSDVDVSEVTVRNNDIDVRSNVGDGLVYPPTPAPAYLPGIEEIVENLNVAASQLTTNPGVDFNGDGAVGLDDLAEVLLEMQRR